MLKEYRFNTDEVELNYAKGPDGGPPLVLLHGLTERWQFLLPIIPHLLLRHTLYAVDHRGHGKSGRVAGRYRCADYGEDMRAFIEGRLREPAILLGRSIGGLVAAYVASRHPQWVKALVLIEPAIWDVTHIQWVVNLVKRRHELASLGKTAAELREILQVEDAYDWELASKLSQLDPGPLAAFLDGSVWEGYEIEAMLRSISCPVLLLYGNSEKTGLVTQEQAEQVRSTIPDCVTDYVDTGHAPHREQPDQVAKIVMGFLESL